MDVSSGPVSRGPMLVESRRLWMVESDAMSCALSGPGITPNSFRWKAALVIVIAVVVRGAFVVAVDRGALGFESNPDSLDYLSFAHNLATGVGFAHAVDEGRPFSQPVEFSAWRPPLYPAVLAVAFRFSRNAWFLQSLQVAFAGVSLYFFLRLGFVLFGGLAALIGGLLFAFYPPLIMYSADLGTESLFLLLLTAVFFLFYAAGTEHSLPRVFSLGLLVGLAALCRPNGLMLAPALVLSICLTARCWRQATGRVVVLTMAVAMVVLPWTYRNYRVFHKFVLISTNGGANFWAGAHTRLDPGASLADIGFLHMLDSMSPPQRRAMEALSEPEQEREFYRMGSAIVDHSPRRLATMAWRNFAGMYALVPSRRYHNLRNRLIYCASYIPLLVSGIIGFGLVWRRWKEFALFWVWMVANTALYCLYLTAIRYRIPTIDPILMLGSGVCFAALLGRHRRVT
jgi:4-amino-4-deoxy-L-arabinose transferase-like glycosyltransferase